MEAPSPIPLTGFAPVKAPQAAPSRIHSRPKQSPGVSAPLAASATALGVKMQKARQATRMRESNVGQEIPTKYAKMVEENRMITVEESQLRYFASAVVLLIGIYRYVEMQAAGSLNYSAIAVNAAGFWALFESARQSI
ncbi:unnamed protein product [Effrenium voratum]|nr:unnamed protein product [Effrenium voratum]|mmetsp:Transcript_104397/g.248382  ORF Transcript_104397/g.248382 Transcript_104397/m.248382 type:complete len:138 (-) Transcript_104397:157-570(-)